MRSYAAALKQSVVMKDFTGEHSAAMCLPLTDREVMPPLEWDVFTYLQEQVDDGIRGTKNEIK